ncbi:MAG: hypothetical protein JNM26_02055, partial [Ideonella sp.]|nr:hypothetical protein [Ideonella sp.]
MNEIPPYAAMQAEGGEAAPEFKDEEKATVQALYRRARDHADDELGPKLERAWRAYDG